MRVWISQAFWVGALAGGALLGMNLLGMSLAAQTPAHPETGTYSSSDAPPTATLSVGERADIYLARRDYPGAIRLLSEAVHDRHADASIYNRLGIAYQQESNLRQAQRNYKRAIATDHGSATYRNNLGTVYYMQRKYKQAAAEFTAAIGMDTTKATYYVNLGGAEFAQNHMEPSLAAYRQALRLDPNSLFPITGASPTVQDITGSDTPSFHYELSRLFCSMGMLDDALHQFRQAYEQHYSQIKRSLTDPMFAPLRTRPEYRMLMGLPPAAATPASSQQSANSQQ